MSLKLYRTVAAVLYVVSCVLVVLALLAENMETLCWILAIAVILVSAGIKARYWRCPKCKAMLPNGPVPKQCPNCNHILEK